MRCFLAIFLILPLSAYAQLRISVESGLVATQYNDVRVPNREQVSGTLFSYADDFDSDGSPIFLRAEVSYLINKRHTVEATAAPLLQKYSKNNDRPIDFAGATYSGADVNGSYQFNTYRLSYRYRIVQREKLQFDLGASLLIRDARIVLSDAVTESEDTDLGYVPLVSFELNYKPYSKLGFMLKGDALVGPVGRAEDVFAGVLYDLAGPKLQLKAGYRLIEGGADVDQVYNFAYFHFANIGVVWRM